MKSTGSFRVKKVLLYHQHKSLNSSQRHNVFGNTVHELIEPALAGNLVNREFQLKVVWAKSNHGPALDFQQFPLLI